MAAAEELPQDLVFVDLETTGGNAAYDRITEIGILRVTNGELVEEWSSLVNPECPIPQHIEAFTGINDAMVAQAPRFAELASTVREKLRDAVFVAHNARFDYSFLRSEFAKADMSFTAPVLCTVKLSRRLFPEYVRHNLDAVMERNGLTCDARHRALGDARVLHEFWSKLRRDLPQLELASAVQTILSAHRLPAHLPPGLADDLPEGPGAYRFFGEDGVLLYVGKSNALRSAVYGHLAAGEASPMNRRLAALVRRVDWVPAAGELGAMLREADWIKETKPLYNRHAKSSAQACTLRVGAPRTTLEGARLNGARLVQVVLIDTLEPQELTQCFGVFHSERDARRALIDIARARELCLKVLGLEDGAGSCFAYQVGKCRGACVGKEPLILHDTRLQLALSSLKLKSWPFPGRIALRERAARGYTSDGTPDSELHVLDHWSYLGTAHTEEELAALGAAAAPSTFDVDMYRILVRYLSNHPKLHWHDMRDMARAGQF
jgi:DNA polymerase III subunit epsilon